VGPCTSEVEEGTDVEKLRYVLATAAAAILGLLAYGLVPSYQAVWGLVVAALAFVGVVVASNVLLRPDDRDPTIRPSSVPRKRVDR
jgi:hypothetical protein